MRVCVSNVWHPDTKTGNDSSSRVYFGLTKGGSMRSRCLKPQLAHSGKQIGLLQRFGERRGKECARFAHICATISADGYDGRARIFVVSAFDISRGALAIDCGYRVRQLLQLILSDVHAYRLAYEGPSKCNQILHHSG